MVGGLFHLRDSAGYGLIDSLIMIISATAFAKELGFKEEDLHSDKSIDLYKQWKQNNCQPNYWMVITSF